MTTKTSRNGRRINSRGRAEVAASSLPAPDNFVVEHRRRVSRAHSRRRSQPWRLMTLLALADTTALAVGTEASGRTFFDPTFVPIAALWLVLAAGHALYAADAWRLCHRTSDDYPALFYWVVLGTGATALLWPGLTRLGGIALMSVTLLASTTLRGCVRVIARSRFPAERAIVVGSADIAAKLARRLELEPGNRIEVIFACGLSAGQRSFVEAVSALEEGGIDRVIFAQGNPGSADEHGLDELVAICRREDVKLTIVPAGGRALGSAAYLAHLAELPVIEFSRWRPSWMSLAIKRGIDLVGATVSLIALAPLMLVVAILVKVDSPGPVLYRQTRVGQGGKTFTMLKFRSMVANADLLLADLVDVENLAEPMYKLVGDPRTTRVGRVLRRTSIDEIPQLVNVLTGQMSLVGPRPEAVDLVNRYSIEALVKLEMRPGMTGPMQVYGRGDLRFQERVDLEHEYVQNHSLTRDLKMLMRTVTVLIAGRGAY